MSAPSLTALGDLAHPDPIPLPHAASLVLWTGAYLRGDIGPDDAIDAATGSGHRAPVAEPIDRADTRRDHSQSRTVDVFEWMTHLRKLESPQISVVLPAAGRIQGLIPPPTAIQAALGAQQAVVVSSGHRADHTLVPSNIAHGSRSHTVWTLHPSTGVPIAPRASGHNAREELMRELHKAAESTIHLDIVPEEPVAPTRIPASWSTVALPRYVKVSEIQMMTLASRLWLLCSAELASAENFDGPRMSGGDDEQRAHLLRSLRDVAREALAEIVSSSGAPPG